IVPTVDRGLREVDFWSIETAGDRPSMKSTSGLSIWPRNCRAYADRDSTYRRWPSAKIVSKARLDLPDPDSPVNTIRLSRGRSRWMSLRLCSRAPRTTRRSATGRFSLRPSGGEGRPYGSGGVRQFLPGEVRSAVLAGLDPAQPVRHRARRGAAQAGDDRGGVVALGRPGRRRQGGSIRLGRGQHQLVGVRQRRRGGGGAGLVPLGPPGGGGGGG